MTKLSEKVGEQPEDAIQGQEMAPNKATKAAVAAKILAEIPSVPLDDFASLRTYLFRIGAIPKQHAQHDYELTTRAIVKSKLGDRESAISDIKAVLSRKFSSTKGERANICKALCMLGLFESALKSSRELLKDFEKKDDIIIMRSIIDVSILLGDMETLELISEKAPEYAETILSIFYDILESNDHVEAFSFRQSFIASKISDVMCDYSATFGPDSEGDWRVKTEYWVNMKYEDCDELTEMIWRKMDEYYEGKGIDSDILTPIAPFIIRELPAFD